MHTKLCGPISLLGLCGERYTQLLTDDFSGVIRVTSMPIKSGVAKGTKDMALHARKLTGRNLIRLRPDGTKEFIKGYTKKFLDEKGTVLDDVRPY